MYKLAVFFHNHHSLSCGCVYCLGVNPYRFPGQSGKHACLGTIFNTSTSYISSKAPVPRDHPLIHCHGTLPYHREHHL